MGRARTRRDRSPRNHEFRHAGHPPAGGAPPYGHRGRLRPAASGWFWWHAGDRRGKSPPRDGADIDCRLAASRDRADRRQLQDGGIGVARYGTRRGPTDRRDAAAGGSSSWPPIDNMLTMGCARAAQTMTSPTPMLKARNISSCDPAPPLEDAEQRRNRPRLRRSRRHTLQAARVQVPQMPPPVMWAILDLVCLMSGAGSIRPVRREQRLGDADLARHHRPGSSGLSNIT